MDAPLFTHPGHHGHLVAHKAADGARPHGFPIDHHRARVGDHAEQGVRHRVPAAALQAGDGQDLPLVQVEADIRKPLAREVFHGHGHLVVGHAYVVGEVVIRQLAADHLLGDAIFIDAVEAAIGHQFAIPQHIVGVADLKELGHLMGNIDEAHAILFQLAHDLKQVFDLPGGQGRGGFVHDDQLGAEQQGLGDFHHLLFRCRQVGHQGVGVDVDLHALEYLGAPAGHFFFVQ